MKDYKTLLSKEGETWQHVIERYIVFTDADMKDYFPDTDSYTFKTNDSYVFRPADAYSKDSIEQFEQGHNHHVPADLIDLLSTYGSFSIGKGIFEIFDDQKGFLNLSESLNAYNLDHIAQGISDTMLDSLNQYYFFFGVSFPQTDEVSFLYFDKAGYLGKMYIHVENVDLTLKKTIPAMFRGKVDHHTLASVLGIQIDRVIRNALIVNGYITVG